MTAKQEIWTPNPGPQMRALSIDTFELLYGGARGGGKTVAGMVWIAIPAFGELTNPRYRGLVLRKNFTDLSDWIDRAYHFYLRYGVVKSGSEFRFPSGAIIRCGHLADEKSYEKYMGHEYHRILVEELTHIPREEDYLKVIASCRSTVPGLRPSVFATTNPGGPGHWWVKARFVDVAPPGDAYFDPVSENWRIFLPALLSDNPHLANTDYKKQLMAQPEKIRRAWLEGDWDALEGQYFGEWRKDLHVIEPFKIPDHWARYCCLDWGYSPDPWACLWLAFDEMGDCVVYREATGNLQVPSEVAREITRLSGNEKILDIVADPSMWGRKDGDSSAVKMQAAGVRLIQGDNSRVQGWMRIHEYLRCRPDGKPHLRVFKTCIELIRCIPALVHSQRNPEDAEDDSSIDHFPDALRYGLMSRPLPAKVPPAPVPVRGTRARLAYDHRRKLLAKN